MAKCIVFNNGYKYQLRASYSLQTPLRPHRPVGNDYVSLSSSGKLTIQEAYAWDGASGAPDLTAEMRASLVQDGLYQLMRQGLLDVADFRADADEFFDELRMEYGMSKVLPKAAHLAIRAFGSDFADPANDRPPTHAPANCEA